MLQKVSKRTWAALAIVTAVVAVPAGLLAWGPTRETFTMEKPAPYVTFNSITNAKNYGDERNFVTISKDGKTYTDDITVANGEEYWVRIYVHNNAASNLKLVAKNVVAKLNVPSQQASKIQIDGYVDSSNAKPKSVWDQAIFHGANNTQFKLNYVDGSAEYRNQKGNFKLGNGIVGNGAKLGYTKMDGEIPGCFEYSGAVFLKVKASTADFAVSKTVRKAGSGSFTENVKVNPGDKVDYQLYFKNTGGIRQTTVSIKDILPAGMKYVAGSTQVKDSNGLRNVADGIAAGGMSMGNFAPNGDVYIKFTAEAPAKDKLKCGTNTLVNTMSATTSETGTKTDTATVTVDKECEPPVEKVKACNLDTMKIENDVEKSKIDDIHYTLDLTKCEKKPELVTACNLDTKKIEQNVEKSKIDNIHYTLDLEKCKTPEDKDIQVCRLSDKKYPVTIKESQFDATKYSKNPEDCKTPEEKTIEVCRLSDKKYPVTIKESEFDSTKYSKNPNDCKETPPVEKCEVPGKEHLPKDSPDCKETPEVEKCPIPGKEHLPADSDDCEEDEAPEVEELPETGVNESILSLLGAGSLVGMTSAYVASRRK